jgi:multidrug efflux pump
MGVSEASQTISFAGMAERQQALGRIILEDPAVEAVILHRRGRTNATINSGRIR